MKKIPEFLKVHSEEVEVRGKKLTVREICAGDWDFANKAAQDEDIGPIYKLLGLCVYEGKDRVFEDVPIKELLALPVSVLMPLSNAITRVMGLDGGEIEKN